MPESVLQEADRLINGNRQADYGHPLDNYQRIAALWSAILGQPVTAEQAVLCMVAMKMARLCHSLKRDSIVDLAGYAGLLELMQVERERRLTASTPTTG